MIRRIAASERAAAAVEFALIAPFFLAALFGLVEGGRMMWTRQALQQAAFSASRCMALNATGCTTVALTQTYAVTQARRAGVAIIASRVQAQASVTCSGQTNMRQVRISTPFISPARAFLPRQLRTITVAACFPEPLQVDESQSVTDS